MKQHSTPVYKNRLWEAVKQIERGSRAEAVVVFRERSGDYAAIPLLWGLGAAWSSFTVLMYAPVYFENWLVYYLPLLCFAVGYGFGAVPAIQRLSVKRAVLDKQVEIMARAIFHKAGIHHTQGKTGILIYCSVLERRVSVLPDRGLELAVPQALWQQLRRDFDDVFADKHPEQRLLTVLEQAAAIFARYLPAGDGDLNELPDRLEVEL